MTTIRVLIALSSIRHWTFFQMECFSSWPIEIISLHEASLRCPIDGLKACKLKKSLYGLNQAPQAWFKRFRQVHLEVSFTQNQDDSSLLLKERKQGVNTFIGLCG